MNKYCLVENFNLDVAEIFGELAERLKALREVTEAYFISEDPISGLKGFMEDPPNCGFKVSYNKVKGILELNIPCVCEFFIHTSAEKFDSKYLAETARLAAKALIIITANAVDTVLLHEGVIGSYESVVEYQEQGKENILTYDIKSDSKFKITGIGEFKEGLNLKQDPDGFIYEDPVNSAILQNHNTYTAGYLEDNDQIYAYIVRDMYGLI